MNTKRILIRTCWFLLAGITPVLGQDINGTWFLNGFHTEVNANNVLPMTESLTGTATINVEAGSISFSTNLGNWTEDDGFTKIGDTFRMVYPQTGDLEFMIAIRVIDDNTLTIAMTETWPDSKWFDTERTEGIAGVLTRQQIPSPDPQGWVGQFTVKGMIIKERNEGGSLRLQLENDGTAIEANPGGTSFRLQPDNPDGDDEAGYANNLVQVGNALHWEENDSTNYILWGDPSFITRHVQTRDQARVIQLDGGRLAFLVIYNVRAVIESSDSFFNGIRFISEFEYASAVLTPIGGGGDPFADAVAEAGLTGEDALPNAIPFNDGVENILKFAFNMNLAGPDSRTLAAGGNSGLPGGGLVQDNGGTFWRVEYLRRKDSGLAYAPQKSGTMQEGSFVPLVGTEAASDIPGEPVWERVVVHEPVDPATETRCFFRVGVEISGAPPDDPIFEANSGDIGSVRIGSYGRFEDDATEGIILRRIITIQETSDVDLVWNGMTVKTSLMETFHDGELVERGWNARASDGLVYNLQREVFEPGFAPFEGLVIHNPPLLWYPASPFLGQTWTNIENGNPHQMEVISLDGTSPGGIEGCVVIRETKAGDWREDQFFKDGEFVGNFRIDLTGNDSPELMVWTGSGIDPVFDSTSGDFNGFLTGTFSSFVDGVFESSVSLQEVRDIDLVWNGQSVKTSRGEIRKGGILGEYGWSARATDGSIYTLQREAFEEGFAPFEGLAIYNPPILWYPGSPFMGQSWTNIENGELRLMKIINLNGTSPGEITGCVVVRETKPGDWQEDQFFKDGRFVGNIRTDLKGTDPQEAVYRTGD